MDAQLIIYVTNAKPIMFLVLLGNDYSFVICVIYERIVLGFEDVRCAWQGKTRTFEII